MRRKAIIVLFVVVGALVAVGLGIATVRSFRSSAKQGTVTLVYNLADHNDTTVSFNGKKSQPLNKSSTVYALAPGSYRLVVSRFGFGDFSTSLQVSANQPVLVNVQLALVSDSTITGLQHIPLLQRAQIPGETITDTHYFYNKTWAVLALAAPGTDNATVVVSYDPLSQIWSPVLGPGTTFRPINIQPLQPLVQAYLTANSSINPGGSNNNE